MLLQTIFAQLVWSTCLCQLQTSAEPAAANTGWIQRAAGEMQLLPASAAASKLPKLSAITCIIFYLFSCHFLIYIRDLFSSHWSLSVAVLSWYASRDLNHFWLIKCNEKFKVTHVHHNFSKASCKCSFFWFSCSTRRPQRVFSILSNKIKKQQPEAQITKILLELSTLKALKC